MLVKLYRIKDIVWERKNYNSFKNSVIEIGVLSFFRFSIEKEFREKNDNITDYRLYIQVGNFEKKQIDRLSLMDNCGINAMEKEEGKIKLLKKRATIYIEENLRDVLREVLEIDLNKL